MRAFICLFIIASVLSTMVTALPVGSGLSNFAAPTFCSRFEQACATTCGSAKPVTVCKVNTAVLKRGSLGNLSCKCSGKSATSSVIASMFKPMSSSASSNSTASSNSQFKKITGAGNQVAPVSEAHATASTVSSSSGSFPTAPTVANNAVVVPQNDIIGTWTSSTAPAAAAQTTQARVPSMAAVTTNGEAPKPVVL
ncbi:hypothetical protein BDZ90DRAFT_234144 [Jaminaea rosea]|uniref:Extracellular membrane protein CFEM domain-containing protein n=1 Tax=Jaminaea rosea TaxID=1569628 RepID=A0A316UJ19_9BASI|nr:hypothetical protein BDZ90DRAFT_234144 [Jaminaea rosea]PWN25297.1 hypothetical protein BDZ90DRAFT_234144 [Jaminaea rosea]